jgi:hypothetical protein
VRWERRAEHRQPRLRVVRQVGWELRPKLGQQQGPFQVRAQEQRVRARMRVMLRRQVQLEAWVQRWQAVSGLGLQRRRLSQRRLVVPRRVWPPVLAEREEEGRGGSPEVPVLLGGWAQPPLLQRGLASLVA